MQLILLQNLQWKHLISQRYVVCFRHWRIPNKDFIQHPRIPKYLKVSKEAKLLYQELCNIVKDKISVKLINVYSSRTNLNKILDLRDRKCISLTGLLKNTSNNPCDILTCNHLCAVSLYLWQIFHWTKITTVVDKNHKDW